MAAGCRLDVVRESAVVVREPKLKVDLTRYVEVWENRSFLLCVTVASFVEVRCHFNKQKKGPLSPWLWPVGFKLPRLQNLGRSKLILLHTVQEHNFLFDKAFDENVSLSARSIRRTTVFETSLLSVHPLLRAKNFVATGLEGVCSMRIKELFLWPGPEAF